MTAILAPDPAAPPAPVVARSPIGALATRFRLSLLATCLLSIGAYALAESDLVLALGLWAGAVGGWFVTERRPGRGVPRWATTILLLLMLGVLIARTRAGQPPVSSFATFLGAVMVVKLWERRALRDYGQILTIAVFLVIGAALTSNSVVVGLWLALLIPTLAWCVMLHQLFQGAARSGHAASLAWSPVRLPFAGAWVLSLCLGLAVALAVFVAIPRGVGLLGQPPDRAGPTGRAAGFVHEVRLGVGGLISQSPTPVFEMRLTDDSGENDLGGLGQRRYLRGIVLDRYENRRWIAGPSRPPAARHLRDPEQPVRLGAEPPRDTSLRQIITFRGTPPADSPVFALYRPVTIAFDGPGPTTVDLQEGTGWVKRFDGPARLRYVARSAGSWERLPEEGPPLAPSRRGQVSFPSDRLAGLARAIAGEAGLEFDVVQRDPQDDASLARAFEGYLRRTLRYTLQPAAVPLDVEPTDFFVFEAKEGHCEYFASALAALCRCAGIDARVIGGYVASEYDASAGAFIVRQWDAHAWVEVNTGPGRWTVMDATPSATLDSLRSQRSGLASLFRRALERIQVAWDSSVVAFDERSQARLLGQRTPAQLAPWTDDLLARLRVQDPDQRDTVKRALAWAGAGVPIAAAALAALWLARQRSRRPSRAIGGWAYSGPAARCRHELVALLERVAGPKPSWASLASFARLAGQRRPALAPHARAAADALERLAFAQEPDPSASLHAARAALREARLAERVR